MTGHQRRSQRRPVAAAVAVAALAGGLGVGPHTAGEADSGPQVATAGSIPGATALSADGRWTDADGMLLYADTHFDDELSTAATGDGSGLSNAHNPARPASLPYDQTFTLHSLPGAAKVAYLDFDGETIAGSAWNDSFSGGAPMTIGGYDIDGNPANFSAAELDAIQDVWQRVAEDFAAFEIDVTTAAPPADDLLRSSTSDTRFGTRVVITGTTTIYSSCQCGGVSYVGAFNYVNAGDPSRSHAYYQPGFVFQNGVGTAPKTIAEAATHEIGHSLGLSHDSTSGGGGYAGQGAWAPIMGTGYSKPVTQWSKGEFAGATNAEDDLAVITAHGVPAVTDDAGDTVARASWLGTSVGSAEGVIGSAADRDVWAFDTEGGTLVATVSPNVVSPDLDARLELLDGSGTVLAASDPPAAELSDDAADGLGATIRTTAPAGRYYLRIDGVGSGDPASSGYSDYASIGRYRVSVAAGIASNLAPGAAVYASAIRGRGPYTVTFSSAGSSDGDGSIVGYRWDFGDGNDSIEPNPTYTYAAAATYPVTLTVTDDQGASSSSRLEVVVAASGNKVGSLELGLLARSTTKSYGRASVVAVSSAGAPLPRSLVLGAWGGADRRWVLGITDDDGTVHFESVSTRHARAEYDFTVIWVGYLDSPYDWDPAAMSTASVWTGGPRYWATASS